MVMGVKNTITVTIDLRLLVLRFRESGKRFLRVHEVAYELGVSPKTAGKILRSLERLGYAVRWSGNVYMLIEEKGFRYKA